MKAGVRTMISKYYKCPICKGFLQERCLPYSFKNGEIHVNYQLECDTCGVFGNSICNCTDPCTINYHFNKALNSLKESTSFLKDFILKGGFDK